MNIKNIAVLKPVNMYNKKEEKMFLNKSGLILVEFEDNSRRMLDIDNKVDITDYKDWGVMLNKKSRLNYIFRGDTEYYD